MNNAALLYRRQRTNLRMIGLMPDYSLGVGREVQSRFVGSVATECQGYRRCRDYILNAGTS